MKIHTLSSGGFYSCSPTHFSVIDNGKAMTITAGNLPDPEAV